MVNKSHVLTLANNQRSEANPNPNPHPKTSGRLHSPPYPEFFSFSQLSRASLLKAAAAATLLLVSWMFAMVSADDTTSISPARSPVARHPYGTILHHTEADESGRARSTPAPVTYQKEISVTTRENLNGYVCIY